MAALSGVGVGDAVGGIAGGLIGAGMARNTRLSGTRVGLIGGILLSVHCDDTEWTKRAKTILEDTGLARCVVGGGEPQPILPRAISRCIVWLETFKCLRPQLSCGSEAAFFFVTDLGRRTASLLSLQF